MPDLVEVGAALGAFFDDPYRNVTPSHEQLTAAMDRAVLRAGDPLTTSTTVGKARRVRTVLMWATDNAADRGLAFVGHVVALLRAAGRFSATADTPTAPTVIEGLRRSLTPLGYTLATDGSLRPTILDNLAGTKLTEALRTTSTDSTRTPVTPRCWSATARTSPRPRHDTSSSNASATTQSEATAEPFP